jgi:hypothetical protein
VTSVIIQVCLISIKKLVLSPYVLFVFLFFLFSHIWAVVVVLSNFYMSNLSRIFVFKN